MSWTRVPLPERMQALPRDPARGYPVAYVTEWAPSGFGAFPLGPITDDPVLGRVMGCHCLPGMDAPLLKDLCRPRQRLAVYRRLCQVCGQPLDSEAVFIGVKDHKVFREPAAHPECALYGLQVCPGLLRSRVRDIAYAHIVITDYRVTAAVMTRDEDLEVPVDQIPAGAVTRWLYASLPLQGVRSLPVRQWLAENVPSGRVKAAAR